jgi:hypothetical protein
MLRAKQACLKNRWLNPNAGLKSNFFVAKLGTLCLEKFGKIFGDRFFVSRRFSGLSQLLWRALCGLCILPVVKNW